MPHQFDRWEQLEEYYAGMVKTGIIENFDEARWDVRPSPKFGTIEFRVADAPTNTSELAMVAAISQCLVEYFSRELDAGRELPTLPQWFVDENKWRAARYGTDAILILDDASNEELVSDTLVRMMETLRPVAEDLGCVDDLEYVLEVEKVGAPYKRLLRAGERFGKSREAIVDFKVAEMEAGHPLDPNEFKAPVAEAQARTPSPYENEEPL